MCTVTYLPTKNGYYLTSNRDEIVSRAIGKISELKREKNQSIYLPQEPLAKGSWIATSTNNRSIVVLNAAFKPHVRKAKYKKSRGLVMIELIESKDLNSFIKQYDFSEIEPFTFVIFDANRLIDFRWDGENKHFQKLPTHQPIIWASWMLYDELAQQKRKNWLNSWLINYPNYTFKDVLYFHKYSGDGDLANDIQMQRGNDLKTISITSIINNNNEMEMIHQDLVGNTIDQINFNIEN